MDEAGTLDRARGYILKYPGAFRYFIKYPALVLHYSEAEAAAFFCTTNRGKLVKKYPSPGLPCTAVRVFGSKVIFEYSFTILKKSYF